MTNGTAPRNATYRSSLSLSLGAAVLAGCTVFAPVKVPDMTIADCVRANGFPDGTQFNVEEVFRTDGMDRRVIRSADITEDEAYKINKCIAARVMDGAPLPDVAGVSQSVTTKTEGAKVTETYTYGNPSPEEPAASAPYGLCQPGGGVMQGGTGYCTTN